MIIIIPNKLMLLRMDHNRTYKNPWKCFPKELSSSKAKLPLPVCLQNSDAMGCKLQNVAVFKEKQLLSRKCFY
jgi:hypothetical protein